MQLRTGCTDSAPRSLRFRWENPAVTARRYHWPSDVESEARDTGALYFAVVESFVEYFNSDVATPTYGPSESGDENHNPPCYGTSGYCPGG